MNPRPRHFIDTNIFIYSLDASDAAKKERAAGILDLVGVSRTGVVSAQVLGETFVNLQRISGGAMTREEAASVVGEIAASYVVADVTLEIVRHAISINLRYAVSYYDALLIAAAAQHSAETLLTEDLQAEQVIEGVRVLHVFDADFDLSRLA